MPNAEPILVAGAALAPSSGIRRVAGEHRALALALAADGARSSR